MNILGISEILLLAPAIWFAAGHGIRAFPRLVASDPERGAGARGEPGGAAEVEGPAERRDLFRHPDS